MNIKAGLWLAVLFLVVGAVLAAQPNPAIQTSVSTVGLQVVYPEQQVFKFGSNVELYFHVMNSTGHFLNTSQVNCTIHLYNQTNNHHLAQQTLVADSGDMMFNLTPSLQYLGKYGYIVECSGINGQTQEGFVAGKFWLTSTGEDFLFDAWIVPVLLCFIPLMFGFLLLRFVTELGEDHAELKLGMSLMSLTTVFLSTWFAVLAVNKFFIWQELQDALGWSVYVYGMIIVVLLTYFIIYLIVVSFRVASSQKVERLRY